MVEVGDSEAERTLPPSAGLKVKAEEQDIEVRIPGRQACITGEAREHGVFGRDERRRKSCTDVAALYALVRHGGMLPGCGPADHPGAAAGQEGVDHGVERWVRSNTEPHRGEETPCSSSSTTPTVDSLRDYINGSLEPASTQTYSPINEDRAVGLPERQLS